MSDMTLTLKPLIKKMVAAANREPDHHRKNTIEQIALANWDDIIAGLKLAQAPQQEWRPISEAPKKDEIDFPIPIILGFAPDEVGEALKSSEGYWRDEWNGIPACWVTSIDPDVPHVPPQPTDWMPLPAPPLTEGE